MTIPGKPLNEIINLTEEDKHYLHGAENWLMRMYFYMQSGLSMTNNFHAVALTLLAFAVVFKDMNAGLLTALGVAGVVLLVILGRYNVHKLSKMNEWLSLRFSTHFGIKAFNYQEEQTKLLREIRDMLRADPYRLVPLPGGPKSPCNTCRRELGLPEDTNGTEH